MGEATPLNGSTNENSSLRITTCKIPRLAKSITISISFQIFLTLQTQKLGTEELDMSSFKNQSESLDLSSLRLSSASCLSATCHPTSVRRHRHYGISGHSHDVDIIESCHCVPLPPICRRESNFIRFHEGTPYEETLDVGRCAGSCDTEGERSFCKSVRNKTVTVQGPNGAACFPVVEECQCVGNCYRTREFLEVYDYSLLFPKLNAQNMSSSLGEAVSEGETISNEPLVKVRSRSGQGLSFPSTISCFCDGNSR